MHFEPKNRHLLVFPIEEEKENSLIVLPEDYKTPKSQHVICDILDISSDCNLSLQVGDRIIVERNMIQEIKALGETNYLVLENYVYGRLQDE